MHSKISPHKGSGKGKGAFSKIEIHHGMVGRVGWETEWEGGLEGVAKGWEKGVG